MLEQPRKKTTAIINPLKFLLYLLKLFDNYYQFLHHPISTEYISI